MTNPLTSLDELIWKQFEKVTQYAHKEYGWDKYDLAHVIDSVSGVVAVGTGTYGLIVGTLEKNIPYLAEHISLVPLCGFILIKGSMNGNKSVNRKNLLKQEHQRNHYLTFTDLLV